MVDLPPDWETKRKYLMQRLPVEAPMKQTSLDQFRNIHEVIQKVRKTYGQAWPQYNAAKTREKLVAEGLLLELLDHLEEPKHQIGRKPFSVRDRLLCMFIYAYGGYSSRRAMSDVEIARRRGLLSVTPHFNSVLNMFRDISLTKTLFTLLELSSLPLRQFEESFSIDASGFTSSYYERWLDVRTEHLSKRKKWVKLNLVVGNRTNIVTSVLVSDGSTHESRGLPELVQKTSRFFKIKDFCADKGYSSRQNLAAIAGIGAIPFIPFKSNTSGKARGSSLWKTMYDYFTDHQEDFLKHYHRRSNAETAFSMIKKNFRNHLRMKSFTGQVNELLVKCLCHNLSVLVQESFELGLNINLSECYQQYKTEGGF